MVVERSYVEREWIVAPPHPDCQTLARDARIAPLLAQLLLNRGVKTASSARAFLAPDFRALLPPEQLANAVEAGRRLAAAVRAGQRIVIYGDYDVDGVTATAILWHALMLAGANVGYYIPSRLDEGYGLNGDALERLAAEGAHVVISVDCGVTAVEEARRAKALGIELIITDHHQPGPVLPPADLIVHPTAVHGPAENPDLSGAGVALKVAWAFVQALHGVSRAPQPFREYLLDATALAALGMVADVSPLTGENRVIASHGLRRLRHTGNPGLQALLGVAGLTGKKAYDEWDVGFMLAPRLNAVGRLGHAALAVELFTHADAARAAQIAAQLDEHNRERQTIERRIAKEAEALVIERGMHRESCRGIVLAAPGWHPGVIGIVASRIVERFCRPTVLIALAEEECLGSGRSVRHFPLHEVLAACGAHLVSHGGHAMAAGVRIRAEQIDGFTRAFQAEANRRLTPLDLRPRLQLDDEVELDALLPDVVASIQQMAPFGVGNPRPRLATGEVELLEAPRVVGSEGQHLQFSVRQGGAIRKAIAFNRGPHAGLLADHPRLRLAFEPIINEWRGQRKVELKVVDWKWRQ